MQPNKVIYEIDGANFSTLEEFYDEVSRVLIPNVSWGRNVDAFNDILRGGFGTPDWGFVLRWKNSTLSKDRLGYRETVRQLEQTLLECHPTARELVASDLANAKNGNGETVFEKLVRIIQIHRQDGEESEDGVELILD